MEKFSNDVIQRLDALPPTNNILQKVTDYNTAMAGLVEEHAQLKTKTIKIIPESPWFDAEYVEHRKERTKAEKKYRRSALEADAGD